MTQPALITIFGEVLFDCFPDGSEHLGGAPFNVAWHLQAFGERPRFITRVGRDAHGVQILEAMKAWGFPLTTIQVDALHPTGSVVVRMDGEEASYDIVPETAYDFIQPRALPDQGLDGILYHGSLALRSATSASSLQSLKQIHRGKIFVDVNLRSPWWSNESMGPILDDADYVKLNEHELLLLSSDGSAGIQQAGVVDFPSALASFAADHAIEILIVTRGAKGALLLHDGQIHTVAPTSQVRVIDTVGAGDAFAAVVLLGLHRRWALADTLARASAFASLLVSRRGATIGDPSLYQQLLRSWGEN